MKLTGGRRPGPNEMWPAERMLLHVRLRGVSGWPYSAQTCQAGGNETQGSRWPSLTEYEGSGSPSPAKQPPATPILSGSDDTNQNSVVPQRAQKWRS